MMISSKAIGRIYNAIQVSVIVLMFCNITLLIFAETPPAYTTKKIILLNCALFVNWTAVILTAAINESVTSAIRAGKHFLNSKNHL